MLVNALRSLWDEPRVANPPRRVWRDWLLVGVLFASAIFEGIFREELVWRPFAVAAQLPLLGMLLWRRSHPRLSAVVAFAGIGLLDVATIIAGLDSAGLYSMFGLIVFPYALFRWGSGADAAIGFVFMTIPHVMNMVFYPVPAAATAGGFAFLLFPSALGASVRFRTRERDREISEAKLLEREQLARELHDTVAHHISAIVIQAQAGRALAATDPGAADSALKTIEMEASRALSEMRGMIGILRHGAADLAPQSSLSDLGRLARNEAGTLQADLELRGNLDGIRPSIQTAIYRLVQESITNARRHARNATRVRVLVESDGNSIKLAVRDDGDTSRFDPANASGYGLVGMSERAKLHGGTLEAGPANGSGWLVRAEIPREGKLS